MISRLAEHIDSKVLHGNYIPVEFSSYVKSQVNGILRNGINDQAPHREFVEGITIDGAESLDLDDAIWAERTHDGYCLFIHISDVSEALKYLTPLDIAALTRITSIYRNTIIPKIPEELSNGVLSLNEDGEKLTLTLQIDLDFQGKRKAGGIQFYESRFTNLKRYDYDSFGESFITPESQHHETLQLLKEISDKLRQNRVNRGGSARYQDEDRRLFIGKKQKKIITSYSQQTAHNIIEAIMIEANTATGQFLAEKNIEAIYKLHYGQDEKTFYACKQGPHEGLKTKNYTHFTSPIRRYPDKIIHDILKAELRGESSPHNKADLKFVAEYANNTRWKVESIGGFIMVDVPSNYIEVEPKESQSEKHGEDFLSRTKQRLGKELEIYDMKVYIKNTIAGKQKMPQCIKNAILHKINSTPISNWAWAVGVILLGKDKDLKQHLKEKIMNDDSLLASKILNIITQTQLFKRSQGIFRVEEQEEHEKHTVKIYFYDRLISSETVELSPDYYNMNYIKGIARRKCITKVFDYFIELS